MLSFFELVVNLSSIRRLKKPTIVVLQSAAPVLVGSFYEAAGAIVSAGFAGQEFGHALASVLSGATTPQGRLAITWPMVNSLNSKLFSTSQWPGVPAKDHCTPECRRARESGDAAITFPFYQANYSEGMYFGYRYYDLSSSLDAQFPFGFGFSYTTFDWTNFTFSQSNLVLSLTVSNTGTQYAGVDHVQMYVVYPTVYRQPFKQLKGFAKTGVLAPGASEVVSIAIDPERDLLVWSPGVGPVQAKGTFAAFVCRNAAEIVDEEIFTI
jgi:beta-glucosidase